jgi:hypothetical protein
MRQHDLRQTPNWQRLSPSQRRHIEHRINSTKVLEAQIEVCRFRVRIERALLEIERNRRMAEPKNPKLRGLISGIQRFRHDVDRDIEEAVRQLDGAHERRKQVFSQVREHISGHVADLGDTVAHFDELEAAIGDNGAPSLEGGSQESPEASENSASPSAT